MREGNTVDVCSDLDTALCEEVDKIDKQWEEPDVDEEAVGVEAEMLDSDVPGGGYE